jgi:PAS domain S-box-containing protein
MTSRTAETPRDWHAFDDLLEGCMIIDRRWTYLYVNEVAARHGRQGPENILGRTMLEMDPGVEQSQVFARYRRCMEDRVPQRFEAPYTFGDGTTNWYSFSVEPVPEGILVLSIDITERVKAEEDLRQHRDHLSELVQARTVELEQSTERFRTVVENSQDGINLLDLTSGRYTFMSPAQLTLTGFTAEEMNNLSAEEAYERIHPDDRHLSVEQQRKVAAGEDAGGAPVEYRWRVKSGEYRWFSDSRRLVRDGRGQPVALVGVSRDVTDRKQAEALQIVLADVLRALNKTGDLRSRLAESLRLIQQATGFEAVGLRLRQGDDYPYYEQRGFSDELASAEDGLCARGADGAIMRDPDGRAVLECTCGTVLSGRTDAALPCFTAAGSFWTNRSRLLLDLARDRDPRVNPRNRCIHAGYQSFGLFPVRAGREIVGLLQLNDRKEGRFTEASTRFFESLAQNIGMAIQRTAAEEALRVSEQRFRLLVEQAVDGIFVSDAGGVYSDVNEAGCQMLGYTREEILARSIADVIAEEEVRRIGPEVARFANGQVVTSEWRFRRKDGSFFTGEVVGRQLPDGRLQAILRDVTERKRADEALRESEARLRRIARTGRIGFFEWNASRDTSYWSPEHYEIFGFEPGSSTSWQRWLEGVHPADRERVVHNAARLLERVRAEGQVRGHKDEYRLIRADGSVVWAESEVSVDMVGGEAIVSGAVRDISERKHAELSLRDAQIRTTAILRGIADTFYGLDREWRFTVVNPAAERAPFGRPASELLGKVIWDLYPGLVGTGTHRRYLDAAEKLALEHYEAQSPLNGRWYEVFMQGWIGGVDVYMRDITERKQADEALRESEQRERQRAADLQTILDTAPIGLAIAGDARGHHIQGNRANEQMFGLPPGAELSKAGPHAAGFRVFQDGRELAPVELPMQRAIRGEVVREQVFDVVREDGQELAVYAKATPLFDEAGRPRGAVGAFLDITALKRAEQALVKANAALAEADRRKDEFIAVLSHELRNPLAPIRYALPLLGEEPLGEGGRRATAVIDRQVAHLSRLVDDLLDVSRITSGKIDLQRDYVALGAILGAAAEAASPAIAAARHTFEIDVRDAPIWLHVDAARISQAVTNLLNNSAKYTPPGGRIRLEASADEGGVVIRVIDNGVGIAPQALPTVFEMFRQVSDPKTKQGGLGIGLTLAKQLVEMHGGTIEAHSAGENRGAEFVVHLPVAVAAGRTDERRTPNPCGQAARLRVLIVDDNVDLVDMLATVVEADGHQVRKAFDGRSAISAALEYQPHLILLDVGMPDMNGMEVAKELRRHAELAGTRIVALTGWGQAEDRRRTVEAGFDDHLTKPADPPRIRRIIEDVAQRLKG